MGVKETINKIWVDVRFQFFMDVVRISLLALVVVFIIILIKNIESVKLLGDACNICMNRPSCYCSCLG